ncbi:MAG TPA: winged helix-turn-helix domain-containing protein [Gemmataceae bacterium]|nr:winged helix-turn-helix domain-containing protein [Gemmataceae bacterium]
MTTKTKSRRKTQQAAVCLDEAPNANTSDLAPQDATDAKVSQANGKSVEDIQAVVDELVREFGGSLRQWPEFPRVIAEAGLEPQDVSDERIAAASLHLHQRDEQFRDTVREANADPSSPLKVVLKGDPEFEPTFHHSPVTQSVEEGVMTDKKRTRKRTAAKVKGDAQAKATTPMAGKTKKPKAKVEGKMSALVDAAKVLAEEGRPMSAKELIEAMASKGYWSSPGGKTPEATLSAALGSEINKKGNASRFAKPAPGKFTLRS